VGILRGREKQREEAYQRAHQQALALLDQRFHLGGQVRASRDELHERTRSLEIDFAS
jgi:hypothetical protein